MLSKKTQHAFRRAHKAAQPTLTHTRTRTYTAQLKLKTV